MRFCELKQKEVINICSCKSLGYPIDIDVDVKKGIVHSLIVPGAGRLCSFWNDKEYLIPWNCVRQVGDDIILVEIAEEKCLHGGK